MELQPPESFFCAANASRAGWKGRQISGNFPLEHNLFLGKISGSTLGCRDGQLTFGCSVVAFNPIGSRTAGQLLGRLARSYRTGSVAGQIRSVLTSP